MAWYSIVLLAWLAWVLLTMAVGLLWAGAVCWVYKAVPQVTVSLQWFDMWTGSYWNWDNTNHQPLALFICPLPCVVFKLDFRRRDE